MAKVLKQHDFRSARGSYPWAEWLDGQIRQLTQGEDFSCKVSSLRLQAHKQMAGNKDMMVRTNTLPDGKSIILQAVPRSGSTAAAKPKAAAPKKAKKKAA